MEKQKNKSKGNPSYVKKLLRALIVVLFIMLSLPILLGVFIYLWEGAKNNPYLNKAEVADACEMLTLPPKTDFCSQPDHQSTTSLRETLEQHYPAVSTSIVDLKKTFKANLRCQNHYCSIAPFTREYLVLTIYYAKQSGFITHYRITNWEGDRIEVPTDAR
jgi:hypothetical protein